METHTNAHTHTQTSFFFYAMPQTPTPRGPFRSGRSWLPREFWANSKDLTSNCFTPLLDTSQTTLSPLLGIWELLEDDHGACSSLTDRNSSRWHVCDQHFPRSVSATLAPNPSQRCLIHTNLLDRSVPTEDLRLDGSWTDLHS